LTDVAGTDMAEYLGVAIELAHEAGRVVMENVPRHRR
jgi:hypothetical protein